MAAWRDRARKAAVAPLLLALTGCGGILPHEATVSSPNFKTYDQVRVAYDSVIPGQTRLSDLPGLGFDTAATPNIEVLSHVDIIERFVPSNALPLDHVPAPVMDCIRAETRCLGYVFRPHQSESHRHGNVVLDAMQIEKDTLKTGWSAEVVLLMVDGHVVYKVMSGQPNIQSREQSTKPLGPLQDLGDIKSKKP